MFAQFRAIGNLIHVQLNGRPSSETDFNAFLSDWLACYHRHTQSFVLVFDARKITWHVWDFSYLMRLNTFLYNLKVSREEFPKTYDKLHRCYVATENTYVYWAIRLLCAWQKPITSIYLLATPDRAFDVERFMAIGIPVNENTAPDVTHIRD